MTTSALPTQNTSQPRPQTDIDRLAEAWVATEINLSPELRVELGAEGDKSEYGDYSSAAAPRKRAAIVEVLAKLDTLTETDEVDRVTALELRRSLGLEVEMIDAKLHLRALSNIASPAQDIRMVFDLMPRETPSDFEDIARRLENLPAAVEGYTERLGAGIMAGVVPAKRQVREVAVQTGEYAAPGNFFEQLAESSPATGELSQGLRQQLQRGAELASAAYAAFTTFLDDELLPAASETDAVGREHYALASRGFLGAAVDLDETYEWGLAELARMKAEQEAIANEILPGASVAEAIAHLELDPTRKLHGKPALKAWMQETSDRAVAELAESHFDIPEPMRRLECMIAPTEEGGIYYTGPSEDFSRPGRMWWSVTPGVTEFDTWRELTTVYHEGVPGHHLQIARATLNRDQLNTWRRNNWTSGHGEGWALYAERLMEQLGYLDEPADRLGMLDGQRMRAARVVLDIGVHLGKTVPEGDKVWDYEYALDFMRQHVNMPDGFVKFEVNRYFGWPGQAPAYKIGQRIWEELRADAEQRGGDEFDLKAWHSRALDLGGLGLDTLREVLSTD
ncbi:DUF885 domain-containing protein [Pseudoclavibacter terrae]|uniref:DUF885 domain-containing protein n=1 Tax=Pseudoclavibacter terrae TaxID=1530195 RepID=A0A7J5B352_9MICO|nr:DUF885 domain-containing protein [Pseudoclavibacter terrae]KAB1638421.1 DUF885 domain-containing protein [Pseudoclavibacter terrae]